MRKPSSNDPYAERKRLTFAQAEGVEPLPTHLRLKEISQELRSVLWHVVYESISGSRINDYGMGSSHILGEPWANILYDHYVFREQRMADEFINDFKLLIEPIKNIFATGDYVQVFGFLQFVLRHRDHPYDFTGDIDRALAYGRAAYRVLDQNTIIPVSSDAERVTLERAFSDLAKTEFLGARSHLRDAGSKSH